jgi:hypothetical protein
MMEDIREISTKQKREAQELLSTFLSLLFISIPQIIPQLAAACGVT